MNDGDLTTYEDQEFWKCPCVMGGISSISIDGKKFKRYAYEIPEDERVTHTISTPVTLTIHKPTKPYYEMFGYASAAEMMRASHIQYKTKDRIKGLFIG